MIDQSSRYYTLETASLYTTDSNGRQVLYLYKRRRFLPRLAEQTTLAQYTASEGDRLDNVATYYLRDPQQSWRICDANPILHPNELLTPERRRTRIAMPNF